MKVTIRVISMVTKIAAITHSEILNYHWEGCIEEHDLSLLLQEIQQKLLHDWVELRRVACLPRPSQTRDTVVNPAKARHFIFLLSGILTVQALATFRL